MLRSISSNWTLNALQIAVFMVLTPFTFRALGTEAFGIWEVIVSTAAPIQLLALGLPMATVRAVSGSLHGDDPDAAGRAAGTAFSMTLILGLVAAAVGAVVYAAFSALLITGEGWSGLSPEVIRDARLAIVVILANASAGFALALPYALFDAHHDFVARNLIKAMGLLAKLGVTVAALTWRSDLLVLAWVQVGMALLEFSVAMAVSRRRHPKVRLRPRAIQWKEAHGLLSFSVFAFLMNMGAMLAFRIDAVVIGLHAEPEAAAVYGIGNKIFDPFINILLAIGMVLMPLAAAARSKGDLAPVKDAFLKWSKIATTIVLLIGGYLMVLGPAFLAAWIGEGYDPESGRLMQILMLSFFCFLPIRGVALPALMGIGQARLPGFGLLAMGLGNLGLSLALVGPYGLTGVAIGTAVPNVLFAAIIGGIACRSLGVPYATWASYALGKPALVAAVAIAGLYGSTTLMELETFPELIAAGLTYTGLFTALCLLYAFARDPLIDTGPLLRRLPLPGGRPR
ncbi:MAG: oligosaccharide flippase family protein [Planctomycetota bacterium]|nr:oligosaccharide flippase family protein [Planctomycetota bacterium]